MDMTNLDQTIVNSMSEAFKDALANGEFSGKQFGANGTSLKVGLVVKITGFDFRKNQYLLKDNNPTKETEKEYREQLRVFNASDSADEDRREAEEWLEENCVKRSWGVFTTDNNDISVSSLFGESAMFDEGYWNQPSKEDTVTVVETAEDFDISKCFKPSCRKFERWIIDGCKDNVGKSIIGKTFRCVGTKHFVRNGYTYNIRAWQLVK